MSALTELEAKLAAMAETLDEQRAALDAMRELVTRAGRTAPALADEELCLTAAGVAKALGVSRSTAYALMQRGDIPSVVLGPGIVRCPAAALRRQLEEGGRPRVTRPAMRAVKGGG